MIRRVRGWGLGKWGVWVQLDTNDDTAGDRSGGK